MIGKTNTPLRLSSVPARSRADPSVLQQRQRELPAAGQRLGTLCLRSEYFPVADLQIFPGRSPAVGQRVGNGAALQEQK